MNADTWLRLATDGLPEAVKIRIAQDTREHLADAGLESAADVEPVLGAPEDTAKELRRLYLTEAEFDKLSLNTASFETIKAITGIGAPLMTYLAFVQPFPFLLFMTLLYIVGMVVAWRLPPLRQQHWLLHLSAFLNASYLMTYGGKISGLPQVWITLLVTVILCWRAAEFWQQDQKLRRTLQHAS
ncbi:hypothetical protein WDJ50_14040 [Deinococcus sp. VB142]|uniref:Uncharacterized protein n=1 Tax=Deinococcus sp. VB142 TaxID=3112952 RepID=A0AAU6Q1J5_9DEIO